MPELPEVETTRLGISPFLMNKTITAVHVRQQQLRFTVPPLQELCCGQQVQATTRRAKYLLIHLTQGYLLIHLGMSGHLRIVKPGLPTNKHDHIDLIVDEEYSLRYNDPRRFGLWLYATGKPEKHPLLAHLGPEPLSDNFNLSYLSSRAVNKQQTVKTFIMCNEIVVGVGNIYATESLFLAGIHPQTPARLLSENQLTKLIASIKQVLQQAIDAGGTTLRDFFASDGKPGYFANHLQVYGRKNQSCFQCHHRIQAVVIGGRNSSFCPQCQPLIIP
ncbi:bifunctional DNA-formamidopyrimidine glycosylase/DNA-(apurinic or apyrimidinic site) lyase [Legionella jamestowniensis]|uniref:Formamidopyrimidine-DNA glycosylase n=1 Tax=Legionella jamestowniensis TaxID=455 RepID=A0A0W0UIC1_9GAMM|nr:bifunctional DNA-formamidopyrimidine glycosylase/DNA-(apurinic or apyrimidinic site) lyase [Legionella jamestowniensis]KTD07405.1 formamidopyrimidine-DNA glycosylase [Legionella jamestowniensis]OCH97823.1 DNA-formamidopyrimidine glycosylase [Legionella jamestowniensis]SFL93431.1 DNA-(apurinic or apyrimidinic site) lyase [Legionella jamestowniensis DSM 19215]